MTPEQRLETQARKSDIGVQHRMSCPWCEARKGETNLEPKLYFIRQDGLIKYNCFSASCTARGYLADIDSHGRKVGRPEFRPQQWSGNTYPASDALKSYLDQYGINHVDIMVNTIKSTVYREQEYMILPITNWIGGTVGDYLKNIGEVTRSSPKNLVFKREDTPLLYFPALSRHAREDVMKDTVVLVEDPISAIHVSKIATAAALLGTDMRLDDVFYLKSSRLRRSILFLDPDATQKAFALQGKYNHLMDIDVLPSPRGYDPKDIDKRELIQLLKPYERK